MKRILPDRPLTGAELQRRYRERNRDLVNARQRAARKANPEVQEKRRLAWKRKRPAQYFLYVCRKRAKARGLEFAITADDLVFPTHCPVLGMPLVIGGAGKHGFKDSSPTIDRIDNSKGYVPGNIQIISWRANRIKCDATVEELKLLVKHLESRRAS